MEVTFDRAKRAKTLRERGIDFTDAARVFDGTTVEFEDFRKDYGERRFIAFGRLAGRRSSTPHAAADAASSA